MVESAEIIQVEILLLQGPEPPQVVDAFCVDKAEFIQEKEVSFATISSLAENGLPGKTIDRLVYKDDEDDWCTLDERTLTDALEFVEPMENAPMCVKLTVVVRLAADKPAQPEAAPTPQPTPTPPPQPAAPPVFNPMDFMKEHLQREIKKFLGGADLRTALPGLARAGLKVIERMQEPALFALLDVLTAFADGHLGSDDVLPNLPTVIGVLSQLPPDQMARVMEMAKEEGGKVVAEVRKEAGGAEQAEKKEKSPVRSNDIEVHTIVICDGCAASPIIGKRYRSLEKNDYDLCESCYDSEQRDERAWKRIRSDVVANAVEAPPGCHVTDCHTMGMTSSHICDNCERGITGPRYACLDRPNFDLCAPCYASTREDPQLGPLGFEEINAAPATASKAPEKKTEQKEEKEDVITEEGQVKAYKSQDKYLKFKTLEPLSADFDVLRCTVTWKDQGWGNTKGRIRATVYDEEAKKKRCRDVFHLLQHGAHTIVKELRDVDGYKLKVGDVVTFEYFVGGGGGHELHIQSFKTEVNVSGPLYPDMPNIDHMTADEMRWVLNRLMAEPQEQVRKRTAQLCQKISKAPAPAPEPEQMEVVVEPEPAAEAPRLSAIVLGSDPLALPAGITWAQRDDGAGQGDATEALASVLAGSGANQAFRLGRVCIHAGTREELPISARVVIVNDGNVAWPERTAMTLVAGESLGFELLPLAPLGAGEAAEIVMDLRVPPKAQGGLQTSTWALVDVATGAPLGPIVLLETLRGLP